MDWAMVSKIRGHYWIEAMASRKISEKKRMKLDPSEGAVWLHETSNTTCLANEVLDLYLLSQSRSPTHFSLRWCCHQVPPSFPCFGKTDEVLIWDA